MRAAERRPAASQTDPLRFSVNRAPAAESEVMVAMLQLLVGLGAAQAAAAAPHTSAQQRKPPDSKSSTAAASSSSAAAGYSASIVHFDAKPVVSRADGSANFEQVFNPSWVVASPGTGGKAGLLIR